MKLITTILHDIPSESNLDDVNQNQNPYKKKKKNNSNNGLKLNPSSFSYSVASNIKLNDSLRSELQRQVVLYRKLNHNLVYTSKLNDTMKDTITNNNDNLVLSYDEIQLVVSVFIVLLFIR